MNRAREELTPNGNGTPAVEFRPTFTDEEIRVIRTGIDGVKGTLPARCYYDPKIYEFEVEHVLKKNWICVGRWDMAEKPGDYCTTTQFGEPIVIVRDRKGELHALINVCRHRWAQVVPNGRGNVPALVCPYHSWTYNLDGTLRGMTGGNMPEVDKKLCALPKLRLEVWQGLVFINFDPDAQPLTPQLAGAAELIERHNIGTFRTLGRTEYPTTWNFKYSFETGYEAYHHEGVHKTWLGGTAAYHHPKSFGRIWGAYTGRYPYSDTAHLFGPPPWKTAEEATAGYDLHIFIGIYPNLILFVSSHQCSMITSEFTSVAANRATTSVSVAPWALERPGAEEKTKGMVKMMLDTQDEDTAGCEMLQRGVVSKFNRRGIIHPLESQLSHYYNWWLDQYLNS